VNQLSRQIRFGLWYDFRNPSQWRQSPDQLYAETLDQIAWGENHGFDDVWLSEHHFIEDGYLPSILPVAAAVAARTKRIRIASNSGLEWASNTKSSKASACPSKSAELEPTNRWKSFAAFLLERQLPSRANSSTSKVSE
jgi:hypothetical protein